MTFVWRRDSPLCWTLHNPDASGALGPRVATIIADEARPEHWHGIVDGRSIASGSRALVQRAVEAAVREREAVSI